MGPTGHVIVIALALFVASVVYQVMRSRRG